MQSTLTRRSDRDGSEVPLLESYDSNAFGPLFAVSDEGSAGRAVVQAAYGSAKARTLGLDPAVIGFALDGERMTSAGEVPIGPDEYEALAEATVGRLFTTTNVGVRSNARLSQLLPEFPVTEESASDPKWVERVCEAFAPFLRTPDGRPRPLTVRLWLKPGVSIAALKAAVGALGRARVEGKIGPLDVHQLAPLLAFNTRIKTDLQIDEISRLIKASGEMRLREVAIDGALRGAARHRLGIQSLLNVLSVEHVQRLLREAKQHHLTFCYRYGLDVDSAARTIWTGLYTAHGHGFSAGKYGLVPMTLEEQAIAIELIERWCRGWTAIPAFYVDTPLVTATDVYDTNRAAEAARLWLKMARGAGAGLVLFDCPDRVEPRRLLRSETAAANDRGLLTMAEVGDLMAYGHELGVSILWSGGITGRQAFELAKRKVFGIFSTSSTAEKIPVSAAFERDPFMAAENEPTEPGIRRIHAIVQAGFLAAAVAPVDEGLAASIHALAGSVLDASPGDATSALEALNSELERGWKRLHPSMRPDQLRRTASHDTAAVPADAVRVFRGRRQPALSHATFVEKLGSVFMPMTVQMQRLYGLRAYLPAVLPEGSGPALPDEVALVFYNTQAAYHEAKRCIGGRAYSALHDLLFDMAQSPSSFPQLLTGSVTPDTPYHLLPKSVDWQSGAAYFYAGKRRDGLEPRAFIEGVAERARALQNAPGPIDGAIFSVTNDGLIWWEHSPKPVLPSVDFASIAEPALSRAVRFVPVPVKLTAPFRGLSLDLTGDAIGAQFEPV